jgi:hypothetical protein
LLGDAAVDGTHAPVMNPRILSIQLFAELQQLDDKRAYVLELQLSKKQPLYLATPPFCTQPRRITPFGVVSQVESGTCINRLHSLTAGIQACHM